MSLDLETSSMFFFVPTVGFYVLVWVDIIAVDSSRFGQNNSGEDELICC